jgi:CrcB protein
MVAPMASPPSPRPLPPPATIGIDLLIDEFRNLAAVQSQLAERMMLVEQEYTLTSDLQPTSWFAQDAWLRFKLVNHLEPLLPRRHWGTLGVNRIACFALGLVVGLEQSCGEAARRLLLLLSTGFLGSFSTFSTFVAELQTELTARRWDQAALLLGVSLVGGLLALRSGLLLGAGP